MLMLVRDRWEWMVLVVLWVMVWGLVNFGDVMGLILEVFVVLGVLVLVMCCDFCQLGQLFGVFSVEMCDELRVFLYWRFFLMLIDELL